MEKRTCFLASVSMVFDKVLSRVLYGVGGHAGENPESEKGNKK